MNHICKAINLVVSHDTHNTVAAIELQAETAAIARHNAERFLVRRRLAILAAPPEGVFQAMLAGHQTSPLHGHLLKGRGDDLCTVLNVEVACKGI